MFDSTEGEVFSSMSAHEALQFFFISNFNFLLISFPPVSFSVRTNPNESLDREFAREKKLGESNQTRKLQGGKFPITNRERRRFIFA
jgi:hypothetical protein